MKQLVLGLLLAATPLTAGRWSGEVEYFPSTVLVTGDKVVDNYHNDMAWRVGGHYHVGPFDFTAKYFLGHGSVSGRDNLRTSTYYHSTTASAELGGWLWRIYLGGRVLARHTGFRQEFNQGALLAREKLDAVGAGAGAILRLRLLFGLAVGAEVDLLANQLRIDTRLPNQPRQSPQYKRLQPGADGQLYIEYAHWGKHIGGHIRLGSYVEGLATGDWDTNNYTRDDTLAFGGLFINLALGF